MKNLWDIQKGIRDLERIIKDATVSLNAISSDFESICKTNVEYEIDYDRIRRLASNIVFTDHPLKGKDTYLCQIYIALLLCVMRLDETDIEEKLIFIQWILDKSGAELSLENVYKECFFLKNDIYDEINKLFSEKEKESLLADMLIIAYFNGNANTETLKYIIDFCSVLNIERKTVEICSICAKIVLCQDTALIDKECLHMVLPYLGNFRHYFDRKWYRDAVKSMRKIVVRFSDTMLVSKSFKWKVKQQSDVKKGEVIASYNSTSCSVHEIKAPVSGTLFQFRHDGINYGVISGQSDQKDSIKKWIISGGDYK